MRRDHLLNQIRGAENKIWDFIVIGGGATGLCVAVEARASVKMAPQVAILMAEELGRDQSWIDSQIKEFTHLAREYVLEG